MSSLSEFVFWKLRDFSRFSRDVTASMLVCRRIVKKVFWDFDSIIMQNLSDTPLFCTPTWPSHHVSEKQKYTRRAERLSGLHERGYRNDENYYDDGNNRCNCENNDDNNENHFRNNDYEAGGPGLQSFNVHNPVGRKRSRTLVAKVRACSSRCCGLSSVVYHSWEGKSLEILAIPRYSKNPRVNKDI